MLAVQVYVHGRGGRLFARIDQLYEARQAEGDVALHDACKVEGAKRHLSARLAYGLRGHYADGLARLGLCVFVQGQAPAADLFGAGLAEARLLEGLGDGAAQARVERAGVLFGYLCRLFLRRARPRIHDALGFDEAVHVERLAVVALCHVYAVLAVQELYDVPVRIAHGPVVFQPYVLEGVDQAALHVAALLRANGRVHQPLPAAHGVEKELQGREPLAVVCLYEAVRVRIVVVLAVVGQGAVGVAGQQARPAPGLLAEGAGHLAYVERRAARAGRGHDARRVGLVERLVRLVAGAVARLGELVYDVRLEGLFGREPARQFQRALFGLRDQLVDPVVALAQARQYGLLFVLRQVKIPVAVAEPVVGDELLCDHQYRVEELFGARVAVVLGHAVQHALGLFRAYGRLVDDAADELAVLYDHVVALARGPLGPL